MNASQLQRILIESGYIFKKIAQENTEQLVWVCTDDDNIPVVSGRVLSDVIWKMNEAVGRIA